MIVKFLLTVFISLLYAENTIDYIASNDYDDYDEDVFEPLCDINFDGENDCSKFFSFAATNWRSKDYRGCVDQYKTAIYCDCVEGNQDDIYRFLGKSFSELDLLDSAYWSFEEGLRYDSDNELLLEYAAWNAGKLMKTEDQVYYLDRLLEINPSNIQALLRMSDTYKKNEMFQEQINILNLILDIDEINKIAIAEKKVAYSKLGKDQTQVDKDRWELDKSNVQFGLDYAQGLNDNEKYEASIKVCNELLVYEPKNKRLLKVISDSHLNIYEEKKALEYLEQLVSIDSDNAEVMIEISELCVNLSLFERAYMWVNKAISTDKVSSKAYFQRAEVLVSLAEYNMGDDLDFCDRLVYDLAFEDYNFSYNSGNFNAKMYVNQLEDYISTKGDWFLNSDGAEKISPSDKKCLKLKDSNCYLWISRKVNSKR